MKFVPYILGNQYRTQSGELVRFVVVANEGTPYETMACEQGIHRYTRRDFGRVTGSPHDYSYPLNVPPLFTVVDDGECESCVEGKCTTGPRCVTLGRDSCRHCTNTGYLPDNNHCQWCAEAVE